mgnify:CR=1 FL=1
MNHPKRWHSIRGAIFGIVCLYTIFILNILPAQENSALVVYPPKTGSEWAPQKEEINLKDFFSGEDIIAVYDDGSALVLNSEDARSKISREKLLVNFELTSPENFEQPLANASLVDKFLQKSSMVSKFEAKNPGIDGFSIVQFQGPAPQEWIDDLETRGMTVLQPLPPYGYLVWGKDADSSLKSERHVKNVETLNAVRKISKTGLSLLLRLEKENQGLERAVTLNVLIADTFENQAQTARDAMAKLEGIDELNFHPSVLETHYIWEVDTTANMIPVIANRPEVFYIEPVNRAKLTGERENVLNIGKFDASGEHPLEGYQYERWLADKGVNGAGVVVQCVDTGLDRGNATNLPGTVHTDILGRVAGVADYSGDDNGVDKHGHGTLNAGIIAGNPFTRLADPDGYLVSIGMAPKTKIFATKVSNSTSFRFTETHSSMVQEARSFGASISLQPWGREVRSFNMMTGEFSEPPAYSSTASEFDALTRVANGDYFNPLPMLFVVSAGNAGWFCDMFSCYVVDKTITDPAFAKNIISVGSFTGSPPEGGNRRDPVQNTSRGPTGDGRIAPTLVAPGIGITGMASQSEDYQNHNPVFYPDNQTLYTRGNGSSHAAAQVVGGAALFTDWWQRFHNYASTPSPAMIKAALVNAAEDEEGGTYPVEIPSALLGEGQPVYANVEHAPEKNQGWGGLNMDKCLPDPGKENEFIFFDQDTATLTSNGEVWEKTIYAIDNDTPMYITLAWTDPAASAGAGKALVNNLDLSLVNGADQVILGNAMKKGWSGLGGTADNVNNVEVIKIQNPYGAFKLRVKATSLGGKILPTDSSNSQDFAIAIKGATLASPKGVVQFTAPYYMCDSTAGVILADLDLAGDGSKTLTVQNQNNSRTLDVDLTEDPPNSGVFYGTFDLATADEGGKLLADHDHVLFVQYNDADDGSGSPATPSSTAKLDCIPPQVTNFVVSDHTAFSLAISFSFNKKASGQLYYGKSADAGSMNNVILLDEPALNHRLELGGLEPCTIYYARMEIIDHVGNTASDDNGGIFYSFQTLEDEPSFFDDFDMFYNANNFTHTAIQGEDDWERIDDTGNSYSPTHYMRTQPVTSIKDVYLKTKNTRIQPYSRLTFYHKFSMEPGFDGAVVEISTDNGAHWRDLGNHITEGKYNAMIALFSGNPLMARLAWTYAWDGKVEYRRSWIDLHDFRNKTCQIRFRMASDDSVILPNSAWYVDDVKISYDSDCKDTLFIRLNRANYGPDESVDIRVFDPTLPSAASVTVKVTSDLETTPETVTLTNAGANIYTGNITIKNEGASSGDGLISCTDGGTLTVLYSSSDNGGTSNPDQTQAKAFYYLPSLILSPPLNEGVTKANNDVENMLVFPMELSAVGADIILNDITFKPTIDSRLDPVNHVPPQGAKLYVDTNTDRALTIDDNPTLSDEKLAEVSINTDGSIVFSSLNFNVTRDSFPRLFLLLDVNNQAPFGTKFQFEIADLANDVSAQLSDGTPITAVSEREPKGLNMKIISRAILVDQNAPTIYLEDGETWETAFRTIGDAVILANGRASRSKQAAEIWVARGLYEELLSDHFSKAVGSNVELYGGFGGDESNKVDPRHYISETMLAYPHRDFAEEFHRDVWYIVELYGGATIDGFHIFSDYNYNTHFAGDRRPWPGGVYAKPKDGLGINIRNCIFRNLRDYAIAAYNSNDAPNSRVINCAFVYLRREPVEDLGLGSMFINCSFWNVAGWDVRGRNYYFYNCAWDGSIHEGSFWTLSRHLYGDGDDFNRVRNCFFAAGAERTDIYEDDRNNKLLSPEWVNPDYLDFRLKPGSPAIDAGRSEDNTKPELAEVFPDLDINGQNRITGSAPDAGCCEYVPGEVIYYIKDVSVGDDVDPKPIVFRPDKPVSMRFTIGSYNSPATLITLGGKLSMTDRYFAIERNLGLFAPITEGSDELEQIRQLPFSVTLTGNPAAYYNLKFFLDFMDTDNGNEIVDTAFFQYQMPAFVDPVNGSDDNRGGIREPFKTLVGTSEKGPFYILFGQTQRQDPKIFVAEGTLKDQIYYDNTSWWFWPARRVEILGGFNPRTWEREPRVFETVWTGENQHRIMYNINSFAVKIDGFTIKDTKDEAIVVNYNTGGSSVSGYWYFGPNEFTNNIFRNNNDNSILRLRYYGGRRWYSEPTYWGIYRTNIFRSSVGAPLANAGEDNGSIMSYGRGSNGISLLNDSDITLEDFTIEMWINPANLNRMYYWSEWTRGWLCRMWLSDNNFLKLYIDEDYYNQSNNYRLYAQFQNQAWRDAGDYYGVDIASDNQHLIDQPGKWYHVAVTCRKDTENPNRKYVYLYIDGKPVRYHSENHDTPFTLTPSSVVFGGGFEGAIDEVRIWNRALGGDEIALNRDKEISKGNGLIMAHHFNNKSGDYDDSAAGDFPAAILPWNTETPAFVIRDNLFEDNKAQALHLGDDGLGHTLIHNNVFRNNQNRIMYMSYETPFLQVSNNVVINNTVPDQNPLFYFGDWTWQNQYFLNNTIVNNQASVFGAARTTYDGDYLRVNTVLNNIIRGNVGDTLVQVTTAAFAWDPGYPGRFLYNIIDDKDVGELTIDQWDWLHNTSCAPVFDGDGYHLLSSDACARNAGAPIDVPAPLQAEALKDPYIFYDEQDENYFSYNIVEGDRANVEVREEAACSGGACWQIRYGSVVCTYTIPVPQSGEYEVNMYFPYIWWHNANVTYTVIHKNGTDNFEINPQAIKGTWYNYGNFQIDAGSPLKIQVVWTDENTSVYIPLDNVRLAFRPNLPDVPATLPPPAFVAHNFWDMEKDIDGQERPVGQSWDAGADQYVDPDSVQGALLYARLGDGSPRLAGLPFDVDMKLSLNYDTTAPAGFAFKVQYPAGSVTDLTATANELGAAPTVGAESAAGDGKSYRLVSALPGNASNTERNPEMVTLGITVSDPYPGNLTIEILPPDSGDTVVDTASAAIPVRIDDSLLENLQIMAPNPVANFSGVPTRGLVNPDAGLYLPVYFQDASLGYVTSWEWDFGDGITSFDRNPSHEYIDPGFYTVTLTVEGPYGKSTKVRTDYIVASDPRNPPTANFTGDPFNAANNRVEGPAPLRVEFLDATNGPASSYSWDFGDATTSNAQNPTKIYNSQGDYTVTLTVDGPMGDDAETKTAYVHVTAPETPEANFTVDNPFGFAPHNVKFQNASSTTNVQFFYYDFGDGNWSSEENPNHQYIIPGQYAPRLTIAGAAGFDVSEAKSIEVRQAFPEKILKTIITGKQAATPDDKDKLDFNADGKLDVADIIYYLDNQ